MSHTPTPWKLKQSSAIAYRIKWEGHGVVGDFLGHEDNAAFIVEACNAHERLKLQRAVLLKAAQKWIGVECSNEEGYDALCKAIALCEEGAE